MPILSDQSYQEFVQLLAFPYLVNPGPVEPNAGVAVSNLYRGYCYYTPSPNIQAKVALAGNELYMAMIALLDATYSDNKNRIIRVQHTPPGRTATLSVMDRQRASDQYGNLLQHPTITYPLAETALTSYLHVYPSGTTQVTTGSDNLSRATNRPPTNNWRIGINVVPGSMAAAVEALMPIMYDFEDIDHIKFLAPGRANKSDSVIIFLVKDPDTYDLTKQAVLQAMEEAQVEIQPKFSPMWNEFADGYGEAAEAPINGYSFGVFRCILAYLASPRRPSTAAILTQWDYQARVDKTFETFGIPLFAPHEQGQLIVPPYNGLIRKRFMKARALYENLPADAFQNLQLTAR